jgi:hypothetical protein
MSSTFLIELRGEISVHQTFGEQRIFSQDECFQAECSDIASYIEMI